MKRTILPTRPGHARSTGDAGLSGHITPHASILDTRPGVRRGVVHAAVVAMTALLVSVASAAAAVHVVEKGETLTTIAARNDVTVAELVDANEITDPDLVLAGSSLSIPAPTGHHVVAGDTLWSLAQRFSTSVAALKDTNGLVDDHLTIGRRLEIPAPARSEPTDAANVVATPTGVIAPVLGSNGRGGWRVRTPCGLAAEISDGTPLGPVDVVLDPGHGGSETASIGPNGLTEKDLNLVVALRAAEVLRARGYRVGLTRTTDVYVPIAGRAAIVAAFAPELFVSVHHNGGAVTPSTAPGTQAYHQHADPESRRAAGILYEELVEAAWEFPTAWVGNVHDGVGGRLGSTGDDFYGVLRLTQGTPAVITEFLWLSNGPEADLLARDDVRDAEAVAIADGVQRWFETTDQGSGFVGVHTDTYDSGGGGLEGCIDPELE